MLAIVIPAYKRDFLKKTLTSFVLQSNKNFKIYVGDDNSPNNLSEIIDEFRRILNIEYIRFDNNLGATDLCAHWERCLNMVKSEEWFSMFSDDDLVSTNFVESFYRINSKYPGYAVYKAHLKIINEYDEVIDECKKFDTLTTSCQFYHNALNKGYKARMPEFVFNKATFILNGGFVKFDLAFRSDTATVVKHSNTNGFISFNDAEVLWRRSFINISSTKNKSIKLRRTKATIEFLIWIEKNAEVLGFNKTNFNFVTSQQIVNLLRDLLESKNIFNALLILKISWVRKNLKTILSSLVKYKSMDRS